MSLVVREDGLGLGFGLGRMVTFCSTMMFSGRCPWTTFHLLSSTRPMMMFTDIIHLLSWYAPDVAKSYLIPFGKTLSQKMKKKKGKENEKETTQRRLSIHKIKTFY